MFGEFPEYGPRLAGIAWAVGHWVWLRLATGPRLVRVESYQGSRVEITPTDANAMPMIVPAERLAWSYREAVAA